MTIQSVWASAFVAGKDLAKVSFGRRLLIAVMDGRQRKADEFTKVVWVFTAASDLRGAPPRAT
jgi:hypothetical protein